MGLTLLVLYMYIKFSIITDNCMTFIKDQIKAFTVILIKFTFDMSKPDNTPYLWNCLLIFVTYR